MNTCHEPCTPRGVVASDLHLFARRSRWEECFAAFKSEITSADVLVLNGDIFDFRWSTLPDVDATVSAAMDWLRALLESYPHCKIHYVAGNHDCLKSFRRKLAALSSIEPHFQCHEQGVRIGNSLFVHGDCAHRKMNSAGLHRFRACWDNERRHGPLRTKAYLVVDRLGITRLTHERWFPPQRTVERIAHYLDCACPAWRHSVRDCYFGHTHHPFSGLWHEGVAFHNTGSAIRGLRFNPMRFEIHSNDVETFPVLSS